MSAINKSLRYMKRQLADASKKAGEPRAPQEDQAANTEASHKLEPTKTKDQADKAAYMAKYKEEMSALGKSFDELEEARSRPTSRMKPRRSSRNSPSKRRRVTRTSTSIVLTTYSCS